MTATTAKPRRSWSLPLGLRVFLITALLIALSMAAAIAVTSLLVQRIAANAVDENLAATASAQEAFQKEHFHRLQLISRLFAGDANIVAYFAEAAQRGDSASILSLLDERQGDLGYDFAILLDPKGRVVAHTAKPSKVGEDLSNTALVSKAVAEFQATGIVLDGDNLYYGVAVPLSRDFTLLGFLVAGFVIDDQSARDIQKVSGAEVAFVATPRGQPPRVVATTQPRIGAALAKELAGKPDMMGRLAQPTGMLQKMATLDLAGEHWGARLSPLLDAKKQPVGAIVALSSIDQELASYRQIQDVLLATGVISALIAFFPTFWLTRRALEPVRRLAAAAEAARQGDYSRSISSERSDEVGQLARSFGHLLADLREKRDMETYVTELSKNLPEPAGGRLGIGIPQSREVLLMGLELRGYARTRADSGPAQTLERLTAELKQLSEVIRAASGHIETIAGHRVLVRFEGRRRALSALQAAAEILRPFAGGEGEATEWAAPMLALAVGSVVIGPVAWTDQGAERATVGLPVQQLESLMREGTSGEVLLAKGVYEELKEFLEGAGYQLAPRRGVINPQPFYVLSAAVAARLTGMRPAPGVTTPLEPPGSRATISGISPGAIMGSRFEILSILGSGGMGVVYKARDRELDDLVALKMLRRDLLGDTGQLERLKSELKLARKITHPNVLRTFDFGEFDGMAYISMEYVRGVTLRYLLDQTDRLPYSAGLRLAKQLCSGLAAAHSVGVIHRDIKPENLLLEPTGNAKLMDFGIAKPTVRQAPGQTQEGFIVGTPQYLAPEQLQGQEADPRSDIYSAGVVFYEIFTGQLPFVAPSAMEVMLKHLKEEPAPLSRFWPEIPPALEAIVLRCLKKVPAERYNTVPQLLRDLEAL